jgi:outer membrane protein assembly factor BamB
MAPVALEHAILAPAASPTAPWPTFHYNNAHTGFTPVKTPYQPHAFRPLWTFATNGAAIGISPAIGTGGLIYFGTSDGTLYCLRPNGTVRWKRQLHHALTTAVTIGLDGALYVGGLRQLDAVSAQGKPMWSFRATLPIIGAPTLSSDGSTLYTGSFDHHLYAIDAHTGKKQWTFTAMDGIDATPTVGPDGTIYVGSYDYNFYALAPNGKPRWSQPFDSEFLIESAATVDSSGAVLFGNDLGLIYSMNVQTGTLTGVMAAGAPLYASIALGPDGNGTVLGIPVAYHTMYAADWNGVLHKFAYVDTGIPVSQSPFPILLYEEKWRFQASLSFFSSPAVSADDHVYVGGSDRNFYEFDGDTGGLLGLFPTKGPIDTSPAIGSNGTVYIGTTNGYFYAFR